MTLRVTEENASLVFRSERYFFELGRLRLTIPRFAEPGAMEIVHRDEGGGQFSFRLTLSHLCSAACCTSWPISAISERVFHAGSPRVKPALAATRMSG